MTDEKLEQLMPGCRVWTEDFQSPFHAGQQVFYNRQAVTFLEIRRAQDKRLDFSFAAALVIREGNQTLVLDIGNLTTHRDC